LTSKLCGGLNINCYLLSGNWLEGSLALLNRCWIEEFNYLIPTGSKARGSNKHILNTPHTLEGPTKKKQQRECI